MAIAFDSSGSIAMIQKFMFEAEIYESLNCLPMAARRKLDAVGIKLHLAQWQSSGAARG